MVVLERTLESSLDCKEIKPINPKGNQPLIFTRRTETSANKCERKVGINDHMETKQHATKRGVNNEIKV